MITSREIASKRFEKASFGGYRNDDVEGFLRELAGDFEELEAQNNALNKKLEVLAEKLEEYRGDEESLRTALLGAQKLGDSVVRESKNKAEIIMRDATIKADRAVTGAHDQVEKEKMIYLKLQKDVAAFKNKLLAIYRQHLEIISSLPDDVPEDKNAARQQAEEAAEAERESMAASRAEAEASVAEAAAQEAENEEERLYEVQFENEQVVVSKAVEEEPAQQQEPVRRATRPTEREAREREATSAREYGSDYAEPSPSKQPQQSQKFIPVPRRADPAQSGKFDEYYEDFEDEDSKLEMPGESQKKSKHGPLKFGAGYDLKRD